MTPCWLETVGLNARSVTAVLVTHAHNDHIGAAEHLRAGYGVPVLMHRDEVPHARRDFLDQVSVGQVLGQAWRPGVLLWAVHALRAGGTTHVPVPSRKPSPRRKHWTCPALRFLCTPRNIPRVTAHTTCLTAAS